MLQYLRNSIFLLVFLCSMPVVQSYALTMPRTHAKMARTGKNQGSGRVIAMVSIALRLSCNH